VATITAKQVEYIQSLARKLGYQTPGIAARECGYKVRSDIARELSVHDASDLIDKLTAEVERREQGTDLSGVDSDELIAELQRRGYKVEAA
jgi:hypothetical protein